ncbi:MAG TPA: LysM peptidoglycan-binding domain-containing protein [Thermoflexales bacterium]|nr:LysM peptidoglycan-binding domain-containing protein [Thermoflexales bacterium]
MNKQLRLVAAMMLATLLAGVSGLTTGAPASAQAEKAEILFREDFESPFVTDPFCGTGRCQVPSGWEIWWVPRRETDPEGVNFQPQADRTSVQGRVKSGSGAQRIFVERATFTGGIRRVIKSVKVGTRLRFSALAQVWSTNDEQAFSARPSSDIKVRLGIEQLAGDVSTASAFNPGVVWSSEADARDKYTPLSVEIEAKTTTIVLYTYATMKDPVRHNEVFYDEVLLEATAPAATEPARSGPQIGVATGASITQTAALTPTVAIAPTLVAPTPAPAPTAVKNASGKTYMVQSGDTVGGIAARFGISMDDLRRMNGLTTDFLSIDQELLLEAPPTPPTPTPRPPGPGTAVAAAPAAPQFGLLCVEAYYDNNGDGRRQAESGEDLVPNVFFSISSVGALVATRMTDGVNEPFCVQNMVAGNYTVGATTLQTYNATTPLNDTKVVQGGNASRFSVGLRRPESGSKVIVPTQANASGPARGLGDMALPILAVGIGALLVVGGMFFGVSYFLRQRRI